MLVPVDGFQYADWNRNPVAACRMQIFEMVAFVIVPSPTPIRNAHTEQSRTQLVIAMFWHIFVLSLRRFGFPRNVIASSPVLMMQFETITESQQSISIPSVFALSGLLSILIPEINALLHPCRKIVQQQEFLRLRFSILMFEDS